MLDKSIVFVNHSERKRVRSAFLFLIFALSNVSLLPSQTFQTRPIIGLRDTQISAFALTGANLVVQPGETIHNATVLVEQQQIVGVGEGIEIPHRFEKIDCQGKYIYAGFIDAWSEQAVQWPDSSSGYWNQNIVPHRAVSDSVSVANDEQKLRSQGFAARVVAPQGGIIKGTSTLYLLGASLLATQEFSNLRWQHAQLTVPRNGPREQYPNSPMGATALLRQSLYDARWYEQAWQVQRANRTTTRPEYNRALEKLSSDMLDHWFVFDTPNERMASRANDIAREFSLKALLRGSGREYRDLDSIAAMDRPFLIPINFPSAPNIGDAQLQEDVSLQDLMHWDLAPRNPALLEKENVQFCLTTDGLDDISMFLKNLRQAMKFGLSRDAALASLTTVPAKLLGVADQMGTIEKGKLANLIILDGEFSESDATVQECWVAGSRYLIAPKEILRTEQWSGTWMTEIPAENQNLKVRTELITSDGKVSGYVVFDPDQLVDADATQNQKAQSKKRKRVKEIRVELDSVRVERDRIIANVDLGQLHESAVKGISFITIIRSSETTAGMDQIDPVMNLRLANGFQFSSVMSSIETSSKKANVKDAIARDDKVDSETIEDQGEQANKSLHEYKPTETPILKPLGAYGFAEPKRQPATVVFRNATIWTCDEQGVVRDADLFIRDGVVVAIGQDLEVPRGTTQIDLQGKHVSPGLIDCHSHMGTDGGVNESGQVVTAEVRIGDFIDNSDINIYRQLAGGLTTANILHGSANPIGGQNQVIKLRWGDSMAALKMDQAPAGIKFALGENVKRNPSRYPNTRMGVEQILRDQLITAREYDSKWRQWRAGDRQGLPPRTDLQLEALAEVQRGERWIHCHSYRQDEIVSTLGVLEEFGIQIGTLQHILEGYKVADRIKQHGAMASAFSDWWAYKFEVFDAIPYNGAIMHDQGVVVSFNSDDRELARHMNTEAAKATKYGGVPEEEALKFVTLNPAKQLRIDDLVGSLQPGKHADLVVWSGRPLSTLSRCEQTWIDGIRYFDIEEDQKLRDRDQMLKAKLVQKAISQQSSAGFSGQEKIQEEDRWVRTDIYCATHGVQRHETMEQGAKE